VTKKVEPWRPWHPTESKLYEALARFETPPHNFQTIADKVDRSVRTVGPRIRDLMARYGLQDREDLTPKRRLEALWRQAREGRGIPPPQPNEVDWIFNLTTERAILQQFAREDTQEWVIDQCINLLPVMEFTGLEKDPVHSTILPGPYSLPPSLQLLKERSREPRKDYTNRMALRHYRAPHTDTVASEGMELVFQDIDWLDVELFSLRLPELIDAQQYNGPLLRLEHARIPCPVCVAVVLVTADDKIVAARRSPHRNFHPLTWSLSFEEQLTADPRRRSKQRDTHPFDAVVEGAWEEFHLTVHRPSIRLLSICVELPSYFASLLIVARCAELSSQLTACWKMAPDTTEHDDVRTLSAELENCKRRCASRP
jgi:hypothetical protein